MNGFVLKAYTNLNKKGKGFNISKLGKKTENKILKKEDLYDKIYFKTSEDKRKKNMNKLELHPFLAD
jgi:hypothetical protein